MINEEKVFKDEFNIISRRIPLLRSVILTYDLMEAEGKRPGTEAWNTNRLAFTNHIKPRVIAQWVEETGRRPEEFPWTDDFLVATWVSWRKAMSHMVPVFRQQCGLEPLQGDDKKEACSGSLYSTK